MNTPAPTCKQCGATPHVHIAWPTSRGPQRAFLCNPCAKQWWDTYKHTPSGQCARFDPITEAA